MPRPSAQQSTPSHPDRLAQIRSAREAILFNRHAAPGAVARVDGWIERSWRRCLAQGQRPQQSPDVSSVPTPQLRRVLDANRLLLQAALPVLDKLSHAMGQTRAFAILTNAHGVVLNARGAIDPSNARAGAITRAGADLSEPAQGTTAIGAVLAEQQSVWLHRGEHFFDANTDFSCAGAPLFGPDGLCVGVLDLTSVQAVERPELRHLVSQFARQIENALTLNQINQLSPMSERQRTSSLLLRLSWAGCPLGGDSDGLVCLDADGWVLGANQMARHMVPPLQAHTRAVTPPLHCSDLFAMAFEVLFDAAKRATPLLDVPLWNGLRLNAVAQHGGQHHQSAAATRDAPRPLRDVETALIRQAVVDARGNVLQAARALGVSRATVYRRLGGPGHPRGSTTATTATATPGGDANNTGNAHHDSAESGPPTPRLPARPATNG